NLAHSRLEILGIQRNHLFVESDARHLHGDPWAQRPGGVVLVANDELEPHTSTSRCATLLGWWPGRLGSVKRGAALAFRDRNADKNAPARDEQACRRLGWESRELNSGARSSDSQYDGGHCRA